WRGCSPAPPAAWRPPRGRAPAPSGWCRRARSNPPFLLERGPPAGGPPRAPVRGALHVIVARRADLRPETSLRAQVEPRHRRGGPEALRRPPPAPLHGELLVRAAERGGEGRGVAARSEE